MLSRQGRPEGRSRGLLGALNVWTQGFQIEQLPSTSHLWIGCFVLFSWGALKDFFEGLNCYIRSM